MRRGTPKTCQRDATSLQVPLLSRSSQCAFLANSTTSGDRSPPQRLFPPASFPSLSRGLFSDTGNARSPRWPTQQRLLSIAKWRTRVVWARRTRDPQGAIYTPAARTRSRSPPRTRRSTSLGEGPISLRIYVHTRSRYVSCSSCFLFFALDLVLTASLRNRTHNIVTATEEKPNSCPRIYLHLSLRHSSNTTSRLLLPTLLQISFARDGKTSPHYRPANLRLRVSFSSEELRAVPYLRSLRRKTNSTYPDRVSGSP